MNYNSSPPAVSPKPKNNTRLIIGIIIMAVLIIFATIGALYLANGMNDTVSQFSNVKEPVSVLEALS
jgi:flagellar basal body-associated protein FliL